MRIAIIGGEVEPSLRGEYKGGGEKQKALLAIELAAKGHEVAVVQYSDADFKTKRINGVTVFQAYNVKKGIPILRMLTYRLPSFIKAVKEFNPDIVYSRVAGPLQCVVSLLKNTIGYKFVWSIAGNHELGKDLNVVVSKDNHPLSKLHKKYIFDTATAIIRRQADCYITQTQEQTDILSGRDVPIYQISNIFDGWYNPDIKSEDFTTSRCLWVGKFSGIKGEKELLQLAKLLPDVEFRTAGHVTGAFAQTEVYKAIEKQANIIQLGRLDQKQLLDEYKNNALLVHTSPSEGFSNVFLEAWAAGRPVLSLAVDPSGLLSEEGLGYCAKGKVKSLAETINDFLQDPEMCTEIGKRSIAYVRGHHSKEVIVEKYIELFKLLIS